MPQKVKSINIAKVSLVYIAVFAINIFFHFNPRPNFLGGSSRDALPSYANFLVPIIILMVIALAMVFVLNFLKTLRGKIISTLMVLIIAFMPSYAIKTFSDPSDLSIRIENSMYENKSAGFLKPLDNICKGKVIEYVIPPTKEIGNIPVREYEYKCGDKIGVFDTFDEKSVEITNCKNHVYNSLMRSLGSLKRKSCL